MKNFSDTIGNRTRDLPTCNAVHQPTALPRALMSVGYYKINSNFLIMELFGELESNNMIAFTDDLRF